MKKLFFFLAVTAFVIAPTVNAQEQETFMAKDIAFNKIGQYEIYPSQFDQLVMDFHLFDQKFSGKTLDAFAVRNNFDADDDEILKMNLFVDRGPTGFQGLEVDQYISTATYRFEQNTWYFDNLNFVIPSVGARFFLAVETDSTFNSNVSLRLSLPILNDVNKDGMFQPGDWGIYFEEGLVGPVDIAHENDAAILLNDENFDNLAPVSRISDPNYDEKEINATEYVIKGVSRDQGGSSVKSVEISIQEKGSTSPLVWKPVTIVGDNYTTWEYIWSNIDYGTYVLRTRAEDFNNMVETNILPYEFTVASEEVSSTLSSITTDKLSVIANGSDAAEIKVIARSLSGAVLANKEVTITTSRVGGVTQVDTVSTKTDENGVAEFQIFSTQPGETTVTAKVDGIDLTQTVVIQFTAVDSQPETTPEEQAPDTEQSAPTEGLVKSATEATVYLLKDGVLHPFTSERIFRANGYGFADVVVTDISSFSVGDPVLYPNGYLVSGTDGKVYVIDGGTKRWIAHPDVFEALGYEYGNIISIPQSFIDLYKDGVVLSDTKNTIEGTVFKYPDASAVYLLENGKKRVFINANAFLSRGYSWNMIVVFDATHQFPDGESLQ